MKSLVTTQFPCAIRRGALPGPILAVALLFTVSLDCQADEQPKSARFKPQHGTACWHQGNNRTAIGEEWAAEGFMAAHRTLPLGTHVRVTNVKNGRSTVVRIVDRGPYTRGRVIDLSRAAARDIGLMDCGLGKVRIELMEAESETGPSAAKPSV